jgi:hypothetical protein
LTYSFDLDPGLGGGLPGWVPVPLVGLVVIGVILGLGHRATVVNKPVKIKKNVIGYCLMCYHLDLYKTNSCFITINKLSRISKRSIACLIT